MPKKLPPIHPGEYLKEEFMADFGLTMNQLAKALHVPSNRITAIVNGTRGITAETALRLSRYFGNSPQFWMNMQAHYNLGSSATPRRRRRLPGAPACRPGRSP